MSQISTHILDTSRGKPAWGVTVFFYQKVAEEWIQLSKAITNSDGRIPNFLPDEEKLFTGVYKLSFDVLHYFKTLDTECFYPIVEIIFDIRVSDHYHLPLLISPFGYSTYRDLPSVCKPSL